MYTYRNPLADASLAGITPGVLSESSSFTGAGQRNIQNSISLDGVGGSQNLVTSTTMRPSVDSVNQYRCRPVPRRPNMARISAYAST